MKTSCFIVSLCLLVIPRAVFSQQVIDLWDGLPPTENGITIPENAEQGGSWITNVSKATLTIYSPAKSGNGVAVIICPGGGYSGLAFQHEGVAFAKWLNTLGITGIILKYRMPNQHKDIPLDDAWQAIRYARKNAKELHIAPNKIGIAGFSAGGHLAATASTRFSFGPIHTRPDFSILFYPVITMETLTHGGSRNNLLGEHPSAADIHRFSSDRQVNATTPPAILLLSDDDRVVLPQNSIDYYGALKDNSIAATMYVFPDGGHGWGMKEDFAYHDHMLALLKMWLEEVVR